MRTLQEKYNGIQEGKFSKEHFLAEARMQQPQLITRFNGYDDAVQILKNKGMIQEANLGHNEISSIHQEGGSWIVTYKKDGKKEKVFKTEKEARDFEKTLTEAGGHASINNLSKFHGITGNKLPEDKEGLEKALKAAEEGGNNRTAREIRIALKKLNEAKEINFNVAPPVIKDVLRDKKYMQITPDTAVEVGDAIIGIYNGMFGTIRAISGNSYKIMYDTGDSAQAVRRNLEAYYLIKNKNVTEARLTKNSLTDYRYKATNEMDKYPYEQILRGIRVELEGLGVHGTPTAEEYSKALAKVSKNLAKDSIFYTNQVAGVNPKVDLHDKMVPVTAKNTVDTFNGMKKATLKEGFKKLIKKVLSESEGDMFGDKERAERSANYGQPGKNEYEFYSDPENYNEEEEEFELQEEDLDESKMGDIYQLAQEHDRFEHFVQAVEKEYGPVDDIAELEHIFNSTRGEDDIDYGDENFSDPIIDSDLYEVRKAKSLSELLK